MLELNFLTIASSILITLSIHEASHALAAFALGDKTAYNEGRMTLNPFKHLDFLGTMMFLLVQVGWGKPVPIQAENFKNPKRDQAIVALAGPFSNFLLGLILTIIIAKTGYSNSFLIFLREINIGLCAFNLLPIPPLDGSKVLGLFIPNYQFYRYQIFLEKNMSYFLMIFFIDIYFLVSKGIFINVLSIISNFIKSIYMVFI